MFHLPAFTDTSSCWSGRPSLNLEVMYSNAAEKSGSWLSALPSSYPQLHPPIALGPHIPVSGHHNPHVQAPVTAPGLGVCPR